MFLKNKNIIFKIRRSKVTDYAALIQRYLNGACITKALEWSMYYNGTCMEHAFNTKVHEWSMYFYKGT